MVQEQRWRGADVNIRPLLWLTHSEWAFFVDKMFDDSMYYSFLKVLVLALRLSPERFFSEGVDRSSSSPFFFR